MANTYPKILYAGLQATYEALQTKDQNVLYFCTDTGKIYKGDVDFSNSVLAVSTKPTTPIVGKVYFVADTNTVEAYVNGAWKVLSYPVATAIDANADDVHVASAKAVYDMITAEISKVTTSENTVTGVAAGTDDGHVSYTTGDGVSHDVELKNLVHAPKYDATTRKFTFPVVGGEDLVVDLGKDVFIDKSAANGYHAETQEIWLYLNDGSDADEATLIKVPASGLVDIYTGAKTNGANVTVGNDNKISVDVLLRADNAEANFANSLKLGDTGLYVDLAAYAKTTDVTAEITRVESKVDANKAEADENKAAIAKLNGDAQTEGSVAKAVADAVKNVSDGGIKDAKDAADAAQQKADANEAEIATLKGTETTEGSVAKAVKDAKDAVEASLKSKDEAQTAALEAAKTKAGEDHAALEAKIKENADNITALAAATTVWGTF